MSHMRGVLWAAAVAAVAAAGDPPTPAPTVEVHDGGQSQTAGQSTGLWLHGNVLIIIKQRAGLVYLDNSNPAAPVQLGLLDLPYTVYGMDFTPAKDFLCVVTDRYGLLIIDFRGVDFVTQWPEMRGYDATKELRTVSVRGSTVYTSEAGGHLHAYDISNPASPQWLGSVLPAGPAYSHPYMRIDELLALDDKVLVRVSKYGSGMHTTVVVVDASDKANMVVLPDTISYPLLGTTGSGVRAMGVSGDRLVFSSKIVVYGALLSEVGVDNRMWYSHQITGDCDDLHEMHAVGDYLFIVDKKDNGVSLRILKYSTSSMGTELVAALPGPAASSVLYHDGRVYLQSWREVWSIDVSAYIAGGIVPTPTPPALVPPGNPTPAPAVSVPLTPAFTYLTTTADGTEGYMKRVDLVPLKDELVVRIQDRVEVLGIASPVQPVLLRTFPTTYSTAHVAVSSDGKWAFSKNDVTDITAASGTPAVDLPSALASGTLALAVNGQYLYVHSYQSLMVFDISNPSSPTQLGSVNSFIRKADAIVFFGDYVLVSDARGLAFIDVSTKSSPTKVAIHSLGGSPDTDEQAEVAVSDTHAFLVSRDKMFIYDMSDVSTAVSGKTTVVFPLTALQRIAVEGRWAYVYDWYGRLALVDIANPLAPTIAQLYDVEAQITRLAVRGAVVYAGVVPPYVGKARLSATKLAVYDLRDATRYKPKGAVQVAVRGSRAYISRGTSGIDVVDVTSLQVPSLLTQIAAPQGRFIGALSLSGDTNTLVALSPSVGITLYNVQGAAPVEASYISVPYAMDAAVHGQELFVITFNELRAVSFQDATAPATSGTLMMTPNLGFPHTLAVSDSGTHVYVLAPYPAGQLHVFDATNRAAMVLVGSVVVTQTFSRITAAGGYVYVASHTVLIVVDVTNAAAPAVVSTVSEPAANFVDVAVSGGKAYVVDQNKKLHVYDVSNPAAPVKQHDHPIPPASTGGYDVYLSGTHAHVVVEDEYVIIDVQ